MKNGTATTDIAPALPPGVTLFRTLKRAHADVRSLAFDQRTGLLASGGTNSIVRVWDTESSRLVREFRLLDTKIKRQQISVNCVAFGPQSGLLAGVGHDQVNLWNVEGGTLLRTLEGHNGVVCCVAFDPQRGWLASCGTDYTIELWDAETGKLLRTLEGHNDLAARGESPIGG